MPRMSRLFWPSEYTFQLADIPGELEPVEAFLNL